MLREVLDVSMMIMVSSCCCVKPDDLDCISKNGFDISPASTFVNLCDIKPDDTILNQKFNIAINTEIG